MAHRASPPFVTSGQPQAPQRVDRKLPQPTVFAPTCHTNSANAMAASLRKRKRHCSPRGSWATMPVTMTDSLLIGAATGLREDKAAEVAPALDGACIRVAFVHSPCVRG